MLKTVTDSSFLDIEVAFNVFYEPGEKKNQHIKDNKKKK